MNPTDNVLFFLFQVRKSTWNALKGFDPPSPFVFEARALPGRRAALGDSAEEAVDNLKELIQRELRKTPNPLEWYRVELERLDEEKIHRIGAGAFSAVRKVLTQHYLDLPDSKAIAVVEEDPEEDHSLCMAGD